MAMTHASLVLLASVALAAIPVHRAQAEDATAPKDNPGAIPPTATSPKPETRAESWGPKEIKDLEDRAHMMEPELKKMSPAEVKKWLTIDEHGRNSYEQLKMLSIVNKPFTRKEWESIFGVSAIEGQSGIIGWVGHQAVGKVGLVEYIVPWTGNVRLLDARHGLKDKTLYALSVP